MEWSIYKENFKTLALKNGMNDNTINSYLEYAKRLFDNGVPIIYDTWHLARLVGYENEYIHRMSNSPKHFYHEFSIEKRNGKKRKIAEPLPDLKKIQKWILENILYCVKCSRFAKAYIPNNKLLDNAKFHRGQKYLVCIDLEDFFPSLKEGFVLNFFNSLGYNENVAVMLTKLCCYKGSLPQGAVTSPYLSNLLLKNFDDIISKYCVDNKIRYTRYADDLSFSGNFNIGYLVKLVNKELKVLGLKQNVNKFKVLRKSTRQLVTGIVVNDCFRVAREYRMKIRQEVYYIKKWGLSDHLNYIKEERSNYLYHLLGKINYVLTINPNDEKMKEYKEFMVNMI